MPTFEQDESTNTNPETARRADPSAARSSGPGVLADRYDVLEEIGSGATAITYRGHDRRLNRNVAIKILRQDHALDSNYVQRFEREARAAASVSQGNVVDVYDFGEQDDFLYIVMQYIDGEDLKHHIARLGVLEPNHARQVTTQILAGLSAIHAAGIIHRDIKPQNVLIGRDEIARLTDFGVAQAAVDVGLTTAGTTVGTAAYMAPEQAQAGSLSEATDIYAVGVVLFEMLTGKMPFNAPTPVAMMLAHIQQQPDRPSQRAPRQAIPPDLDRIVMQAMAKDPDDRFRSAGAMSRALAGVTSTAGATTVRAAVPDVGHGTQALGAQAPLPSREPRPASDARQRRVPPDPTSTGSARRRSGTGLRGAVGALLLLLLLGTAAGAAYLVNQNVGNDANDGGDPTSTVQAVVPTAFATLTPTSQASEAPAILATDEAAVVPTEESTATATDAPIEQATDPPTEIPTEEPTQVPTEISTQAPTEEPTQVPTEIPTLAPTEEPTQLPTEIPTQPPTAQPTIAPIDNSSGAVPGDNGQGANIASSAPGQSGQGRGNSERADGPGQIMIESGAWEGDGVEPASGQEWMVVGPGEDATATFDVNGTPSEDTFEVSIAIAAVDTQRVPLQVLLNGTEMGRIADRLPTISSTGNEQVLGSIVLTMPTSSLREGRNELTLVNQTSTNGWAQSDDDDDDEGSDDDDDDQASDDSDDDKRKEKVNQGQTSSSRSQANGLESNAIVIADAVVTVPLAP